VGVGRNLRVPMSDAAIDFLWNEDANEAFGQASLLPWFADLNEARQLAITDMVFNLGAPTFATFTTFTSLMAQANYASAAADLETTQWYREDGQRAVYITNAIRTGEWP
jgi:GH24 family phage-related lysozyme (muramidase)